MTFQFEEIALLVPEVAELGDVSAQQFTDLEIGEKVPASVHSDSTKLLFAYVEFYARRHAEELVKSTFGETEQIRAESQGNATRFEEQRDAMRKLAFLSLRQETDIWDKNIGLRKGWAVIEVKRPAPYDMLRNMFGGGK